MSEDEATHTNPGPGQGPTGSLEEIAPNDPGPIEVDYVMKGVDSIDDDPLAGRDLRPGSARDSGPDSAK